MERSSRNIAALALLGVLLVVMGSLVGWYLLVGHNWNHAATHIDERVGDMQGYHVILFDGTLPDDDIDAEENSQDAGSQDADSQDAEPAHAPITADQVAADYRQKGATVVVVDVSDPAAYSSPEIFTRDGYWVGAFFLEGANERVAARKAALNLHRRDADFVIAVTKDVRITYENNVARALVDDIDLAVYAGDAGLPGEGTYRNSTMVVDSARVGEVQAVIVSPSNVVSAKTVTEIGQ